MPFEFLSDEQIARYGRFPEEPSAAELEQFLRLDRSALDALASKRRPATSSAGPCSGARYGCSGCS
ncbi:MULTISPECIES: DUF4158 domain-containing protein [Streptosporangium]|uniref:DUF4158 domain-containing protein n=1 Tax=Streptosporangium brasiliense TaxID=47480 RepID=A0ABT9RHI0_9ACTN|nr:DUF4158 domain-containing protein [Streptosporangium brasiliense]MDP9868724.1 hypothetical protein [Streptosporangium brasiliense]